jgi:peroxiredoxin
VTAEMAESRDESLSSVGDLQPGATAPDFEASATNDKNLKLSDLKGSWVVLFFYVKAFTGG